MNEPLLDLQQARCSVAGITLLDNVTLRTSGRRVGLSGKTEGIAALLMGEGRLMAGEITVMGRSLEQAREQRLFGCALPPRGAPAKWTVKRILALAAEFAGCSPAQATLRAQSAAERVGEGSLLKCVWSRCSPIERALASLALGLVNDPALLFVRLPIGELPTASLARYREALDRATEGIAWLAELRRPALHAEEALWIVNLDENLYVFEAGASGISVPLGRNRVRYLVRVVGEMELVTAALERAGLSTGAIHAPSDLRLGRSAFLVDVETDSNGVANTGPLLDVCVESNLEILELTPIAAFRGD